MKSNKEVAEQHGKELTFSGEYNAIRDMQSIGTLTSEQYPTFDEYYEARREGRVCGDFRKRVVIVAAQAHREYTFVTYAPGYNAHIEKEVKPYNERRRTAI